MKLSITKTILVFKLSLLCFSNFVFVTGAAYGAQVSNSSARTIVRDFCTKLGLPPPNGGTVQRIPSRSSVSTERVIVLDNGRTFAISNITDLVSVFSNQQLERSLRIQDPLRANPRGAPMAAAKALSVARLLNSSVVWSVNATTVVKFGSDLGTIYNVSVFEIVSGSSNEGVGNTLNITLDASTLEIVGLTSHFGYVYQNRSILVEEPDAVGRSVSRMKEIWPEADCRVIDTKLRYFVPTDYYSDPVPKRIARSILVYYAFAVRFRGATVYVSAESGKILGIERHR